MEVIESNIPLALGDLINIKACCDATNKYDQIKITFHKSLLDTSVSTGMFDWSEKKIKWDKYLADIGKLFFSDPPYILNRSQYSFRDTSDFIKTFGLTPKKPELSSLLCKGIPLNIGEEYIVITTKIREISKKHFYPLSIQLWRVLQKLSKRYKIVILGEQLVETRKEYIGTQDIIFSIYEQIITNIPGDRIIDLTIPVLGENVSSLTQIQQDCLIMNQAKLVITLGIGGNFCMATAAASMLIGFRADQHWMADAVFNQQYSNAIVSKDWSYFIGLLERYL